MEIHGVVGSAEHSLVSPTSDAVTFEICMATGVAANRAATDLQESIHEHVESDESVVIPCTMPASRRSLGMWTIENRGRYDRSKLRYPSDLTDENGHWSPR
jgi:hypothetical protein